MASTDKLIYSLLVFTGIMIVGMFLASWRLILYAYLIMIGISILFGLLRHVKVNRSFMWIPIGTSIAYLTLYVWLDLITLGSPNGGEGLILGMTPATALYFLGIWPLSVLVSLLYAWTFPAEESMTQHLSQ